jgi:hypothetical protein
MRMRRRKRTEGREERRVYEQGEWKSRNRRDEKGEMKRERRNGQETEEKRYYHERGRDDRSK